MLKASMIIYYRYMARCPYCKELIELTNNNDDDAYLSKSVFSNKWDELIGKKVECDDCGKDFLIESVEV